VLAGAAAENDAHAQARHAKATDTRRGSPARGGLRTPAPAGATPRA
jgi:hypothetical protein